MRSFFPGRRPVDPPAGPQPRRRHPRRDCGRPRAKGPSMPYGLSFLSAPRVRARNQQPHRLTSPRVHGHG
eukprot:9952591-Lingulodinium_polyedra.AAC.1